MRVAYRQSIFALGLSLSCAVVACKSEPATEAAAPAPTVTAAAQPIEWVAFHIEVPIADADIMPFARGLLGPDAQAGNFAAEREFSPKMFIKAETETTTPDQAKILVALDDGDNPRRTLAVAPASFQLGQLWASVVEAAVAKMKADVAKKPGSGESFLLEYRTTSSQGGRLTLAVRGVAGVFSLVVEVSTPQTSLVQARIGQAATTTAPYDTVAGTVDFHMSKDDFDYFVDHAYGKGATGKQNFKDFALVPHEWLRLTVDPHLDKKFVEVGFEVIALDGKRLTVAKAPASVLAGSVFQRLVLTSMTTMSAQEKAKPGSSSPWTAPFYYDAPDGGGVVQVVAKGTVGKFQVAYAVESPRHTLKDVAFLEYLPVEIPPPSEAEASACEKLGDPTIVLAPKGTLNLSFKASDVVKKSDQLKGPLVGTIYCSVYHGSDVTIAGPKQGAASVQDFNLPMADLGNATAPTFVTDELFGGEYQVLCAQDLDGSGDANKGDPVTLPIGNILVACNRNPAVVEFALLNPQD